MSITPSDQADLAAALTLDLIAFCKAAREYLPANVVGGSLLGALTIIARADGLDEPRLVTAVRSAHRRVRDDFTALYRSEPT